MNESKTDTFESSSTQTSSSLEIEDKPSPSKGPLSFLIGSLTSALIGWLCFHLSQNMVIYFTRHSLEYSSAIAQSIASGLKTLLIGMCFLATFTFTFIGLGLFLVFIRSLFEAQEKDPV